MFKALGFDLFFFFFFGLFPSPAYLSTLYITNLFKNLVFFPNFSPSHGLISYISSFLGWFWNIFMIFPCKVTIKSVFYSYSLNVVPVNRVVPETGDLRYRTLQL